MSPHYLDSDWCRDERGWWLQTMGAEAFPEIGSRLFVARIWPTGDSPWPTELCDERGNQLLGVWFHDRPGNKLTSRPFGWVDPTNSDGNFRSAIVDLTGQIAVRITKLQEALRRRRQLAANVAKLENEGGQTIYVHARVRDEQRWEGAVDELLRAGYGVVPSAPEPEYQDPSQAHAATKEVVRTLSACDGLLLVSGDPLSLVSDLAVVGYHWRNLARAFARKPLPCAVVDRGEFVNFKQRLQRSAKSLRIEWIDAALANWTGQVKNWLSDAVSGQTVVP